MPPHGQPATHPLHGASTERLPLCFLAVTAHAQRLEVAGVVRAALRDVEDVVNLQVLGASALDAPITVAVKNLFTEAVRCSA